MTKLIIVFPPTNHVSLNVFVSKVATIAVIVEHSLRIYKLFTYRIFRYSERQYRHFRLSVLPSFLVRDGASHHINPAQMTIGDRNKDSTIDSLAVLQSSRFLPIDSDAYDGAWVLTALCGNLNVEIETLLSQGCNVDKKRVGTHPKQ